MALHYGLIYKLKQNSIKDKWLFIYFLKLPKKVVLSGQFASFTKLNASVQQGSILGSLLFLIYINNLRHLVLFSTVQIITTSTVSLNHEYWTVGLLEALSKHKHKMKKRICLKKCLIYSKKKISQILGWMLIKCKIKIFSHASGWLLTKRKTKKSLISFILWDGRWFSLPSELFKTKREINKFTLIF